MACLCRKSNGCYKTKITRIALSKKRLLQSCGQEWKGSSFVCSDADFHFLVSTLQPPLPNLSQSAQTHFSPHPDYLTLGVLIFPPASTPLLPQIHPKSQAKQWKPLAWTTQDLDAELADTCSLLTSEATRMLARLAPCGLEHCWRPRFTAHGVLRNETAKEIKRYR